MILIPPAVERWLERLAGMCGVEAAERWAERNAWRFNVPECAAATDLGVTGSSEKTGVGVGAPSGLPRGTDVRRPSVARGAAQNSWRPVEKETGGRR